MFIPTVALSRGATQDPGRRAQGLSLAPEEAVVGELLLLPVIVVNFSAIRREVVQKSGSGMILPYLSLSSSCSMHSQPIISP